MSAIRCAVCNLLKLKQIFYYCRACNRWFCGNCTTKGKECPCGKGHTN